MLLLVPAQKSEGNRSDDKQNPFSIRPAHSSHNSSSSSSSPPTCGRVLVVLPPRTDMSSTLVVSDKSITTALTTTLCSSQHLPCGELNRVADPATRTYWSRHENTDDAAAERNRTYGSWPQSGNHSRPSRRHSYFRSSVAEHSHARRWSIHPRSRSRSNKTASSLRQKSCISSTTTSSSSSTSTANTTNTIITNTTSRPVSPHPPYSDSQRLLREAFKKTMTVRSPLLTSTSSGMVLDLTPGPALESRWKDVETGKWSSSRLEALASADKIQVSANSKVLSEPESSSNESSHSDRGTSMDMSDAEDRSLDKNDEEEDEEHDDDNDDSNNCSNKDSETHIKMEALDDDQSLHSFAIGSSGRTSSCTIGEGGSTDSQTDLVLEPTTQHMTEALARSCVMNARSKSTSSVPSPFSSPVLPRMPTRPPSAPLLALSGQDAIMTAQDIALGTASLGALTPIEIQSRMYEHAHSKLSSSRWPTRRRSQGDALLSSSSLQTQQTPLPLRKRHASAVAGAGSVLDGICVTGGGSDHPRPPPHHASFPPALPSYYYLPPSAFRTAAAAAAEEQQEAEHRRKKEQERKEKEENSFFEFPSPSPSPSPPSQASPSC